VDRNIPALHLVTDDRILDRADFEETARAILAAGGAALALHMRGPGVAAARLYSLAVALSKPASAAGALLLVNDRVDVALAAGSDGAHLGVRSMTPNDARELLGPNKLIGASVHSLVEAEAAGRSGADFLIAGSIYPTGSHPDRQPGGRELLRALGEVPLPVIAIGGVTPERCSQVTAAGAVGVAVLRGVWSAPWPMEAVGEYLNVLGVE
jgi:thiazole tautomerase (transcriptional regulator TenI)